MSHLVPNHPTLNFPFIEITAIITKDTLGYLLVWATGDDGLTVGVTQLIPNFLVIQINLSKTKDKKTQQIKTGDKYHSILFHNKSK